MKVALRAANARAVTRPNGAAMYRLAYLRVSTSKQHDSGAGLAAQRTAIEADAERRGWTDDLLFIEDVLSGKSARRPGLERARTMLATGEASTLIVAKMDRLSRSLLDFARIMADAQRQGWQLVALDSPADPSTPQGEAMATMLAMFAQLERRLIGERTRAALAEKRAQGVRLGRPPVLPAAVRERIVAERDEGATFDLIAARLTVDSIATARGGQRWKASSVRKIAKAAG
jgi:DNA invertase Pin-like site-specific DNA recombinase